MKYLAFILFTLIASNTNKCNYKNTIATNQQEKKVQENKKNEFYITTLNGKDISEEKLYINFDGEHNVSSGYSGCNTFSCKYTNEGESISFGFPMATKMYCEKKVALEDDFIKTLITIKIKTIKKNSLFLKDSNQKILITGISK